MKPVNIGLLGLGTVGQGTVSILQRNSEEIRRRTGRSIVATKAAVRNIEKARAHGFALDVTDNPQDIVSDPSIDIVCEAMGGEQPALDLLKMALQNGKHVITANKALIAVHGNELIQLAEDAGVSLSFESSVAGGIPIIKALREGMAANQIRSLAGIINGTGNFILTEMTEKGRAFEDVLAEAQALGYAEADPTFDVEGIDAAHKLAIMASVAFGFPLCFNGVFTEGISSIQQDDVGFANELAIALNI